MNIGAFFLAGFSLSAAAAAPDFHADVAPIFRDYCVGCHNREEMEGELSLETFAELMEGGESGEVIHAGDAKKSFLVRTVTKEEKPRMPPAKEPQPSAAEVAVLQAWVNAGAKGPEPSRDVSILSTLIVPEVAANAEATPPVSATAISPDGVLLAVAIYDRVELREAESGRVVGALTEHAGKVNALHFSADGRELLAASGVTGLRGVATLWDVAMRKRMREFDGDSRDIFYDAEFSPDGTQVAAAGYDGVVRIWEKVSGKSLQRIAVHNGAVFDLAYSPDGSLLASASADQTVKLWRTSDGERMDTLNQPQGEQYSVAFTPDGKFIVAAGADKCIRIWRLISKTVPKINPILDTRFAHEGEIVRLAVSGDGKSLVSSAADRSLKVWSLPGLDVQRVIADQPDLATALVVAEDAKMMMVGRMDGSFERIMVNPKASVAEHLAGAGEPMRLSTVLRESVTLDEVEPNDVVGQAQVLALPAVVKGRLAQAGDVDVFGFEARAGEQWVFEVNAARMKSPLDSHLEIFDDNGVPVPQVMLQAVRDSWFTFRGKDSTVSNDFRVHNWMEMDLDQYLYANGEVVKLWLYPRGADSGFNVYPGTGARHSYFGTTPLSHALGEPCYIVRPMAPGSPPVANGLPSYTLNYENDDDPKRRWGKDSQLMFTAPKSGRFAVRLKDVTAAGGEKFTYELTARARREDFRVTLKTKDLKVSPGGGKELAFAVERMDDFEGEIQIEAYGLPAGLSMQAPVRVERGQFGAEAVLMAAPDAKEPTPEDWRKVKLVAMAEIQGRTVMQDLGGPGKVTLAPPAKLGLEIVADGESGSPMQKPGQPLELKIHPGETISAIVKVDRRMGFKGEVPFGKEDAGRNLPFGTFVDNIGLSGLLVLAEATERRFFITAGPDWLPESSRWFHLRTTQDGGQTTRPVLLHVKKKEAAVAGR